MDKTAIQAGAPPTLPPPGAGTALAAGPPPPSPAITVAPRRAAKPFWKEFLEPLASLKLTVALFALSLVIVFYGTLAQVDQGIWYVVKQYFRSLLVWIPLKVVLFNSLNSSPFAVPFPGGWLIGGLLFTNLLAAHAIRFKLNWRRSGIFVLHAGVLIMMLGEFITGLFAVEGIMQITVGEQTNYVSHYHDAELAVINVSDPKVDDTVAIPATVLRHDKVVKHEDLPFDIELVRYLPNAVLSDDPKHENLATAGFGKSQTVTEVPVVSGADPKQKIDTPAAFVTLKEKGAGHDLGTYLVFFEWREQPVEVNGVKYTISLRAKRTYRPYSVYLQKADHKLHPGTDMAKDFSSYVVIHDPDGKELRSARIFMNHPLSFDGATFYQAEMQTQPDGRRVTGLQVVRNPGWIMPYLSCLLVAAGMLFHFGLNLFQFLQRRIAS